LIDRTACACTSRRLIASLTAPVVELTASAAIVLHPAASHSAAATNANRKAVDADRSFKTSP
jgi:hypothetical protein